jgi:predicted nucleic acid-binding protein
LKIIADSNILLHAIQNDHPEQRPLAKAVLSQASLVAIPIPALCELCWTLSRQYKIPKAGIALTIRRLLAIPTVEADRDTALAGLAILDAGGDFADGVIAHQGRKLGGEIFLSFDTQSVRLLKTNSADARVPA